MCFEPTREETAERKEREELLKAERREDPASNPGPRGNQEPDELEVRRGLEKLESVLPH